MELGESNIVDFCTKVQGTNPKKPQRFFQNQIRNILNIVCLIPSEITHNSRWSQCNLISIGFTKIDFKFDLKNYLFVSSGILLIELIYIYQMKSYPNEFICTRIQHKSNKTKAMFKEISRNLIDQKHYRDEIIETS